MFSGSTSGSFRLFTVFGITVYLHWTWFLIAIYQVQARGRDSLMLGALEYIGLFAIVLLHEFGHSLACRQVGGKAEQILLWPFGGVAYVSPPRRPGPVLWSIAAGPLVNVALIPVFYIATLLLGSDALLATHPEWYILVDRLQFLNIILLVFNMLPVYPLDGGQIFQALLWFKLGQGRSLAIASVTGLIVSSACLAWTLLYLNDILLSLLAAFLVHRSWLGFQQAKAVRKIETWPRHHDFHCPNCHSAPPVGDIWRCGNCNGGMDAFDSNGTCPNCGTTSETAACPECGEMHPLPAWRGE